MGVQGQLTEEGAEVMCVCQGFGMYSNIPGTILLKLDESVRGGFQQSDTLHYGYYSLARPKGAGEEAFVMFRDHSKLFFFCARRIRPVY